MKTSSIYTILLAMAPLSSLAQVPNTLLHSIPAPPVGVQSGGYLGYSAATDGAYVVVGAPNDDLMGAASGSVKVFAADTGALLHVLPNPNQADNDHFGNSVAISGTRVAVGAYGVNESVLVDVGRVYVYDLASPDPTVPVATLLNPDAGHNTWFGHSVTISGTWLVVGADNSMGPGAGRAYVYDLTSLTPPVLPMYILNNPTPATGDAFGISVAISGTRVVVGACADSTGATGAGSAYVYDLASPTPTVPVHTLNNPGPATYDFFGQSVSISGTQVVVGAYWDNTGAADAGSAYVYDLTSPTPTVPVHTLNNPGPASGDSFGNSVAISGTRVVVGTYYDNTGGADAGSAYVYDLTSGTPTVPVHSLNNPGPASGDFFGQSVSISGTRVIVGADSDDTGAADAGSAYVYDLTSGTPTVPVQTLNNPGPSSRDNFGYSMAVSGTRVVGGAYNDDTGSADAGSAYVYDLTSPTPTVPVHSLNNPGPASGDRFGNSVAIFGTRVVVGAYNDDTGAADAGSAYVYDLTSGTPTVPVQILNNPGPASSDLFGCSVGISGTRVVVGACADSTGATGAGSAYVYDLTSPTPTVPVHTLNNPGPASGDRFGESVAISGTQVVVGASYDDTGAADAGSAYVYDLTSPTPTVPVQTLNNPGPVVGDRFGNSVTISGTRVAVGARYDDSGAVDAGSAYVYDLTSPTPAVPVQTFNNPDPRNGDWFGNLVSISGPRVVVGVIRDDPEIVDGNAGSAYVYDLASPTPTVPVATLNNPAPAAEDAFGCSVAIDDTTIAIGADHDNSPQNDKGSAYLYGPIDGDNDTLRDPWEITHFGSSYGHGALDDFDHDGYNELLELGFGLDPRVSDPGGIPGLTQEGGYLTLTITKQAGAAYEVQSAGTLLPALPESFSPASTTILIDDATTLKARDNFLISGSPRRFIRAQVTGAP